MGCPHRAIPAKLSALKCQVFGTENQGHCVTDECHGPDVMESYIDLTQPVASLQRVLLEDSVDVFAPQPKRVVPGNSAQSRLYVIVSTATPGGVGTAMPPPPKALMPQCEIDAIRRWIEAGAPAN